MRAFLVALLAFGLAAAARAQDASGGLANLTKPQDYVLKRVSSYDRTGGNADYRQMAAGETLTLLDEAGRARSPYLDHDRERREYHLKRIVLRMYWDGEDVAERGSAGGRFLRAWASVIISATNPFRFRLDQTRR